MPTATTLTHPLLSAACAMLLAIACDPAERAPEPAQPSTEGEQAAGTGERASEPPADPTDAPPMAFEDATLRQEELRGAAMSALDSADLTEAMAALNALSETPEMSELKASGLLLLAELYHQQGASRRAVSILRELVREAPPMAEFEFVLGRTLGEMNRFDQAEPHLRRAIELGPEFLQSYLYLGSLLVASGREAEAAEVYADYERALAYLIEQAEEPQATLPLRLSAIEALSYANPDERITRSMIRLLAEDSVVFNGAAIQVLAEVGTIEAVDHLSAYARQASHEELRIAALRAIDRIRERSIVH